jgi:ankyrin repeat protein
MEFVARGSGAPKELENIWIASSDGDLQRVEQLIEEGVSVNAQDETGYSPMHAAVSYGHTQLIEYLLMKGANLHIRDEDGDTPILVVESPEVFELLVRHGSNPHDQNGRGETLLEKAVDDENELMIKYLVENGIVNSDRAAQFLASIAEGDEGEDMSDDD